MKLKRSEIRREFVLGDTSMALAGVDVNVSINILAVAMDDVFTSECVVLIERSIRPKAVGIDHQRLLMAVSQQESNR